MTNLTIEAIRANPEVVAVLHARARQARAQAVHGLLARLIHRLTPRIDLRAARLHWG